MDRNLQTDQYSPLLFCTVDNSVNSEVNKHYIASLNFPPVLQTICKQGPTKKVAHDILLSFTAFWRVRSKEMM